MGSGSSIDLVVTICVAVFASVTAPLLIALMMSRQRRIEKEQDYEREDKRREEDRAEEHGRQDKAAAESKTAAENMAAKLLASNNKVATIALEANETTHGKLDVIHTLVNNTLTIAKQERYDGLKRELVLLKEMMALREASGQVTTPTMLETIAQTERMINELAEELRYRQEQNESTDRQIRKNPSAGIEGVGEVDEP